MDTSQARILIVDDEPLHTKALCDTLREEGYITTGHTSGRAALEALRQNDFDLLLTDLMMPGLDGITLLRMALEIDGALVGLVMTGHGTIATAVEAMKMGALDYLLKPFTLSAVLPVIARALQVRRLKTENIQLRETVAVYELSTAIAFAADSQTILQKIADAAFDQGDARSVSVLLPTADGTELVVAAVRGRQTNLRANSRFAVNPEIAQWVERTHQLFSKPQELTDRHSIPLFPIPDIAASVSIPLLAAGKLMGILNFWPSRAERPIALGRVKALSILAGTGASGLHAARSLEALTRKADELTRTIQERERIEAQFRQSQKLEGVGQLAGGIAHDFNNLLTVIIGRSQLLQAKLEADSSFRHDVDLILQTGERAAGLTRQLLAFSRKQLLQPRVLDLNRTVADIDKMLRRLIGEHIELVTVLPDDLGAVKVDPGQIEQVIVNLAVNARDAMPNGGKLIIETGNVVLDETYVKQHVSAHAGPYVMLAVTDFGCGMAAETQSRIFEPFFTTKEQGKGTGLGLSTVYGIVKQSGGNIWFYSELGFGTTFKIYLPCVDSVVEDLPKASQIFQRAKGSETILLVEDERTVRELSEDILRDAGYRVLVAANGVEALDVCEDHKETTIDLVVTDVVMPKMGGPELAKRLGSLRPSVKTLFLSGYTNATMMHSETLNGRVDFLQKPFGAQSLTNKVRWVLDSQLVPQKP
jgi:two-component system, cell cycle sensor histidine kinase and response regulator CckA